MAHIKTISPSGWDFDAPIVSMIKIASGGLHGHDLAVFAKRAGATANVFLPQLESVKFAKDEVPIHLIGLGAYEAYGPNRNGDAFSEQTLKASHDTFVKFAKFYRNHKNKDPRASFGTIKASAYNPVMRRVELLVGLNATKEAAERNEGLVADAELEKLARGEDLAVSMACRVPYDICSGCHNRARTREEYCKEASCKYGGCADNLTRLIKSGNDVHHLHVKNEHPVFFDMSRVWRPADRIAYGGNADYFTKAAADNGFFGIGGAKTAAELGVTAPLEVVLAQVATGNWTPAVAEQIKLAHGLACYEEAGLKTGRRLPKTVKLAFVDRPQIDIDSLDPSTTEKIGTALGALADRKIVLTVGEFAKLLKQADLAEDAVKCLPGVYGRMIADGSLETRLAENRYAPSEKLASAKQRTVVEKLVPTHSLEKSAVDDRIRLSTLKGHSVPDSICGYGIVKTAHDSKAVEELARNYACYKAAALQRIARFDDQFVLTTQLVSLQNTVV